MLGDMFEDVEKIKEEIEKVEKESIGETARKRGSDADCDDFVSDFKDSLRDFLRSLKKGASEFLKVIKDSGGEVENLKKRGILKKKKLSF